MRLHGLGELAVEVVPHRPYELGPFVVRFVPSRHSKLLFGRKVPMDGELTCDHLHGLVPDSVQVRRRLGHPDRGRRHLRSTTRAAPTSTTSELRDEPVDVFLAGVAGRSVTPRYWERILPRLDPALVVPTHYDNFFAPLGRSGKFVAASSSPSAGRGGRRSHATRGSRRCRGSTGSWREPRCGRP